MVARVRSHMNEVSQVDRFLFSKIHFLVRDDKHVIVQVFARFGKMSGLVWSRIGYFKIQTMARPTRPYIFPNRGKTCTITYNNFSFSNILFVFTF